MLFLFFLTALSSQQSLFTENDANAYDEDGEETCLYLHLHAIYFCPEPYRWKVWINKMCISSIKPRSIQGWSIAKVSKESVIIRKGKREKTLFVQKNKQKTTRQPRKEKSRP